jgi:hypothetical protein
VPVPVLVLVLVLVRGEEREGGRDFGWVRFGWLVNCGLWVGICSLWTP